MIDLSIIIVNWNSVAYLEKCLKSIFAKDRGISMEVIVVDNASYDGAGNLLAEKYPRGIFVQSHENLGFARANNLGFAHSQGRDLLFLNPDTEIIDSALEVMLHHLRGIPDAGAVGGRLLNPDGSLQISCVQPFPTILNQVFDIEYFMVRYPGLPLWGIKPLFSYNGRPEPVEAVSGACIMVSKKIFEQVGRFSSGYFMYGEDLDLCYKIWAAGRKVYYVGDAAVMHYGGGSTRESKGGRFENVLRRESVYVLLEKTRGKKTAILYRVALGLTSLWRLAILVLGSPFILVFLGSRILLGLIRKWVNVLSWSVGKEKWASQLNLGIGRKG
jgi:GT2 family glycosyltransferase